MLKSKDACRSAFMSSAVEEAWRRNKRRAESMTYSILDFMITERNSLLKDGVTSLIVEDADESRAPTSPNCNVIWKAQRKTAGEVIFLCLDWWEKELCRIEERATELKATEKLARRATVKSSGKSALTPWMPSQARSSASSASSMSKVR
jgi:hypothetical protein